MIMLPQNGQTANNEALEWKGTFPLHLGHSKFCMAILKNYDRPSQWPQQRM
jgi:hypothetical protein